MYATPGPDDGHSPSPLTSAISRRTLLESASRLGLLAAFGTVASACAPAPKAVPALAGKGEPWADGTYWDDGSGWVA